MITSFRAVGSEASIDLGGAGGRSVGDRGFGLGFVGPHRGVDRATAPVGIPAGPLEEIPDLRGEGGVHWQEVSRVGTVEVQATQVDEPAELADRIGVIVHAQVDPAVVAASIARSLADDQQRDQLPVVDLL